MADSNPFLDWSATLLKRTAEVDAVVSQAARILIHAGSDADGVALIASGGYGRCELFPHSDVDLLILAESEEDLKEVSEPISTLLRLLWDAGLRISQSMRTSAECSQLDEQNTELHISLLDVRFLCGNQVLFDKLTAALPLFFERHRSALIRNLAELTRNRHAKYNNTIFHLEPNIKESPGGIRDIHFLHWLNRLAPANEALSAALHESDQARSFLFPLRVFLHERAGRDNNLLSFDLQDEAAAALGAQTDPAEWMRRYYGYARQTWQAARRALDFVDSLDRSLLQQFRDRRSRLSTTDFTVSNDRIFLRNPESMGHPEMLFRLFAFIGRHGLQLSWDAERRLRAQVDLIAANQSGEAQWPFWNELLQQPHASLALHEMQDTGMLAAFLPEWKAIDSLVVRDFYHRYTVDEHTLVAISVIDDLAAKSGETAKRFQSLLAEVDDPALLRLALLLHDIGKGVTPGQHVEGSLAVARSVMNRWKLTAEQQNTILFLIKHHLDLYSIMNRRDLEEPATARLVAAKTRTMEHLRYLTLLTHADISAVNPTAMTPWRVEQLWRVYTVGQEQFTRELQTARIHGIEDLPPEDRTPQIARFLQGLPTRYLHTHNADEIHRHCAMQIALREKNVAVEIFSRKGAYQATVLAHDKPGLFAAVCGALASFGMNIVKAEAFNNQLGLVVDQFRFTDPLRTLELNPSEMDRLRRLMERAVLGDEDVRTLLKRRRIPPRPARVTHIAPSVRFNNDASDTATLVDFVGEDRPGLLFDLASAFALAGCNIEIVLIDTEGHKAIDVFYVTYQGQKLSEAMQKQLSSSLLGAAERVMSAS